MSWTGALAWVDPRAQIGLRVWVGVGVMIGPDVVIGDDCRIETGARIGTPGFGYVQEDGRWMPKPESHGVVVESDVHIGANTCVDRGSYRHTLIGSGTRIDNLVHVAHNVVIEPDCIIVAHAGLGGSVIVERGVWIGFGALIREHVEIGERALIGMGAVVLKDIPPNQTWAGNPARCINAEMGVRRKM